MGISGNWFIDSGGGQELVHPRRTANFLACGVDREHNYVLIRLVLTIRGSYMGLTRKDDSKENGRVGAKQSRRV
jgi:hypothetical protein